MEFQTFDVNKYTNVRKQWLVSFFILSAACFLFYIPGQAFIIFLTTQNPSLVWTIQNILISSIEWLLSLTLIYHFAYKKNGTKWLSFTIIVSTIYILLMPCFYLYELAIIAKKLNFFEFTVVYIISVSGYVVLISPGIYFLINSLKLRRLNASLTAQKKPLKTKEVLMFFFIGLIFTIMCIARIFLDKQKSNVNSMDTLLREARQGDLKTVEKLVTNGVDINANTAEVDNITILRHKHHIRTLKDSQIPLSNQW